MFLPAPFEIRIYEVIRGGLDSRKLEQTNPEKYHVYAARRFDSQFESAGGACLRR
jgi:hypothetical protein